MTKFKQPIYLDYMATTPVDLRVKGRMLSYLDLAGDFGNANSNHFYGLRARAAVEAAREEMAQGLNTDPRALIFTSGATEANNLAIKGTANFYARQGRHLITVATEHMAVLDCFRYLETKGFEVTYLRVQKDGRLDLQELELALRQDTILVSVMQVNNEIGVIHDIAAIGAIVKKQGAIFHVDAAQSMGKVLVDLKTMPADLVSFAAHKVYGPKGAGALFVRRDPVRVHLEAQTHGGGQELGLRPGTLATHQIVGMAEAFKIAASEFAAEVPRIKQLRDRLLAGLKENLADVFVNGSMEARVAHNLNISFAGVDGEQLFAALTDVAVSAGAACSAASVTPSHVLSALGVPFDLIRSSLRFSLGCFTTSDEIEHVIKHVTQVVRGLR